MSKLADVIRRSQRIESAPMGFGAARPAPKATMVVGYVADDVAGAEKGAGAGAEVVVLRSSKEVTAADAEKLKAAAGSAVVGLWGPVGSGQADELQKTGIDFVIFDPDTTPATALLNDDLGYVCVLPAEPDELLLRSLEPLGLDGLYLSDLPSPLTVSRQIELTRVAAFAHKPLICPAKAEAAKDELQCLRGAGAVVLLVSGAAEGVMQLKETVLSLPVRRQRREERAVVSLPRGAAPAAPEEDDDDDDE
jgi:hypothetical protein